MASAPDDPVARCRYARALIAENRVDAALLEITRALAPRASAPAPIVANLYPDAGTLLERKRDRDNAARMYANVLEIFGGDVDTAQEARRALARLRRSF